MLQSELLAASEADKRKASMDCSESTNPRVVTCDYRYSPSIQVEKLAGSIDSEKIQLDSKLISKFPAAGETSAVLFLVDVSDSRRVDTLNKQIIPAIKNLLKQGKSHQSFGLAVFDSEVRILAPIAKGPSAAIEVIKDIEARGLATELYKSILSGIDLIKRVNAQRKIIVVISDGKAEDRSYGHSDVIEAAKSADVSILSVGYSEKGTDAPYLQTLQRLAADTHGLYVSGNSKSDLVELEPPLNRLEGGGRVLIPADRLFGAHEIKLVLIGRDNKEIHLSKTIILSDNRSLKEKLVLHIKNFWNFWAAGLAALIVLTLGIRKIIQKQIQSKIQNKPYAFLIELDSKGTRHPVRSTASRLGRGKENDLIFANTTVSLNHAEIHRHRDDSVWITDLASSNGVLVNGQRVLDTRLQTGDEIELGEVRLRYEFLGEEK
jgi:hypothetical protein